MSVAGVAEPEPAPLSVSDSAHAEEVKEKAVSGARALGLRTLYSLLLRGVSVICLSHLLTKSDYGVFFAASYVASLGMYISDGGLAGGLIQRKEEPTEREVFSLFALQQAIVLAFILGLTLLAPVLGRLYNLSATGTSVMVAMGWGLMLYSLRVVPLLKLERSLSFREIARVELTENTIRTVATITLAALHFGPWALALGQLVGMLVFLAMVWFIVKWRPHGPFDFKAILPLLRFGVPFQLNILLPALMLGPVPALINHFLGIGVSGYLSWCMNLASIPMMLNNVLIKVAFPAYSRLQDDQESLGRFVRASTRRLAAILFTTFAAVTLFCPVFVPLIFSQEWAPAVPLLQWMLLEFVVFSLTGNLAAVQNATGRPMERTWMTLGIGVLKWVVLYLVVSGVAFPGIDRVALIGPLALFLPTLLELLLTTYLVQKRNPGCRGLFRDVFEPVLATGAVLALSLGIGFALSGGNAWAQLALSFFSFLGLTALREFVTPFQVVKPEIPGILALLRRNRV